LGRDGGEQGGESAWRATEIRSGENDAGAHDADADLARAIDGEHECLPVEAACLAELVAGDDRGRIAGQSCGIGRKIAQERGDERACGAPQAKKQRRARRPEHAGCVINPALDRAGLGGQWLSAGHATESPRALYFEIRCSFSLLLCAITRSFYAGTPRKRWAAWEAAPVLPV